MSLQQYWLGCKFPLFRLLWVLLHFQFLFLSLLSCHLIKFNVETMSILFLLRISLYRYSPTYRKRDFNIATKGLLVLTNCTAISPMFLTLSSIAGFIRRCLSMSFFWTYEAMTLKILEFCNLQNPRRTASYDSICSFGSFLELQKFLCSHQEHYENFQLQIADFTGDPEGDIVNIVHE